MEMEQLVKQCEILLEARLKARYGDSANLCSAAGLALVEEELLDLIHTVGQETLQARLQAQADQQEAQPQRCPTCHQGMQRAGKKNAR